jgi:hypothetical protein
MLDNAVAGCQTLTAAVEDGTDGCLVPGMYLARNGIVERERVSSTPERSSIADAHATSP